MINTRTKQLIWRGSVQNAIGNPARIKDQLAREVQRIVERFPSAPASYRTEGRH